MNEKKVLINYLLELKIIIVILGISIIISCDPIWYDNYGIDNKSEFEIKVYYSLGYYDTTIIIPTNTFKEFFHGGGDIGFAKDYGEDFLSIYFDSINIQVNDSKQLSIDYLNRANWEYTETEKGGGTANYKLIINNSDIE